MQYFLSVKMVKTVIFMVNSLLFISRLLVMPLFVRWTTSILHCLFPLYCLFCFIILIFYVKE
jgi:hypothetical protein